MFEIDDPTGDRRRVWLSRYAAPGYLGVHSFTLFSRGDGPDAWLYVLMCVTMLVASLVRPIAKPNRPRVVVLALLLIAPLGALSLMVFGTTFPARMAGCGLFISLTGVMILLSARQSAHA